MVLVELIMLIIILVQQLGGVQMDELLLFLHDLNNKLLIDIKLMIWIQIMLVQMQQQIQ